MGNARVRKAPAGNRSEGSRRESNRDVCSTLPPSSIPNVNSQGQVSLVAPAVMVVSGASLYAGAAVAVGLFESFSPFIVAWFRVAAAGVILLLLYRPKLRVFRGVAGRMAAIYGVMTMPMK